MTRPAALDDRPRVLVCGGRDFNELGAVWGQLDAIHALDGPIAAIIQGGGKGADYLAASWADFNGVPDIDFLADWHKHGRAAGPIRNQQMLDEGKPDLVVAFPGGRGTADMVRRAKVAGIRVIEFQT
jgi:hypothetical protein